MGCGGQCTLSREFVSWRSQADGGRHDRLSLGVQGGELGELFIFSLPVK